MPLRCVFDGSLGILSCLTTKPRRNALAICVVAVLCPISALADVGTPLVWANAFHLFLGNAFIGLFEGWLLARVFRLPKRRCIWTMIAANYLSAWVGMMLMSSLFHRYATDPY